MVHKSRGDYFKAAIPMMPEENKAIASFSRTPRCWKIGAAATILAVGNPYPISQVTFSEKGTKIPLKLASKEFEFFIFNNGIHF